MLPIWQKVNPVIQLLSLLPSRTPPTLLLLLLLLLAELVADNGEPDPVVCEPLPPSAPAPTAPTPSVSISGGVDWVPAVNAGGVK